MLWRPVVACLCQLVLATNWFNGSVLASPRRRLSQQDHHGHVNGSDRGRPVRRASVEDRRLQGIDVNVQEGWEFPTGTRLGFQSLIGVDGFGSGNLAAIGISVLAGYKYSSVQISMPIDYSFSIDHQEAIVKLVYSDATRDACERADYNVPMALTQNSSTASTLGPSPLASGNVLKMPEGGSNALFRVVQWPHLTFMHGGLYELCYSPDGSFFGDEWKNNIVPVTITVVGVASNCLSNGCLANERWDCYMAYAGEGLGSCRIDFRLYGGGRDGWTVQLAGTSRVSWSQAWGEDTFLDGNFLAAPRQECSNVITGSNIAPETANFEDFMWTPLTGSGVDADASLAASLPKVRSNATRSFTLTACYCPNYDGPQDTTLFACDHPSEFIQPIGIVYYWMIRICDVDTYASCGAEGNAPFMRVLPQQPFVLRVECPPGGTSCAPTLDNRVKFLPGIPPPGPDGSILIEVPERAIWEPQSRCKIESAMTSDIGWEPPLEYDEFGILVNGLAHLIGGDRRDYKFWANPGLLGLMPMESKVEVCYCESSCDNSFNYFKVGEITSADSAGIARWTKVPNLGGLIQEIESLQYVTKPGALTLYAGIRSSLSEGMHPYDSIPWRKKTTLKLVPFDNLANYPWGAEANVPKVTLEKYLELDKYNAEDARLMLNEACANGTFNEDYYNGPSSSELAREYLAWVGPSANQYLPFSGIENDQSFNTWKAGIFLVCYCATLDAEDLCASPNYYISAARLMFKGPLTDIELNLPTNFVVRIDLEGWGFSETDSIRLISMTQTCRENANDPRGVDVYRLGCPGLNSSSCRRPSEKEDISVLVISADMTGLFITDISIGDTQSVLTFSGDITAELLDGDAITLDESSILLNGRNWSQWTISEQHVVSKLSGFYGYADEPDVKRMLWNHVSYVYHVDGELVSTLMTNQLSIPLGWPEGSRPSFTFMDGKDRWHRRNRLQTKEEIKVDSAATVKICWGANDAGRQQYYGEAGVLKFSAPVFMADAGVYTTTRVQGGVGMAVLSFSPSRGTTLYKAYRTPVVVRLLFKEVDFMLEPLLAGDPELTELKALPTEEQVAMENATQTICGKLFMEMWTNDDAGFPFPRGCYYGPLYTDVESETEAARPSYREYFIIFEPQAGLKDTCLLTDAGGTTREAPCVYQLALNVRVGEINMVNPREVVGIYTQCAGKSGYATVCGPRYSVLEYGPAYAVDSTMVPEVNLTEFERIELLPLNVARSLTPQGLRSDKALELIPNSVNEGAAPGQEFIQFGLRAWPKDPYWPVERSGQLSIYFQPFTLWSLSDNNYCLAICVAPTGLSCNDGRGGEFADCAVNPFVRTPFDNVMPMQRNTLQLTYPARMDEIPVERFGEAHLLEVSELRLPQEGFFTLRMMAQYLDSNGQNPTVSLVSPPMRRIPLYGTTTGRIVMDGQTGNGPRPFIFERENVLIIRIRIGVTLRSPEIETEDNETEGEAVLTPRDRPMVQILLPPDYSCSVLGNGTADPGNASDLFVRDLNGDGYVDNPMGTVLSGVWSYTGPICTYTLQTSASVFAQQIFYVRLSVNNPRQALLRTDPSNVWRIRVAGVNSTVLGDLVNFISLEEEPNLPGWAGNLAVLTPLEGESLQPSNLSAGATNYLNVFFQVIHAMPEFSYILLDSPDGFDFTDNCSVGALEDLYYHDWEGLPWGETVSGPRALTSSLGQDVNCTTDNWKRSVLSPPPTQDFTRAKVRVGRAMLANKYYAFRIRIRNALTWDAAHHDDWRLWVQSPEGYTVDGSKYTIQYNARRIDTLPLNYWDRSWGIYQDWLRLPLTLNFGEASLLPSSVFDMSTVLTIFPLTPSADGALINMRVLAPVGYVWVPHEAGGWLGEVPGQTCEFCELIVVPEVQQQNELILKDLVMRLGERYGFQVRVRIPERPPTRSTNSFYLEMGFDPGNFNLDRMQAVGLPAPALRVISQAKIDSLCNLAGFAENVMEFHVHIASALEVNAGFFFTGSELTRGTLLRCWPETLTEAKLNSDNGYCEVGENVVTGLPELKMYVLRGTFPAGLHIFRFRPVRNPLQPTDTMGHFGFGTYTDLHQYPKHKVLDQSKDIPVPRVLQLLPLTGLVEAPDYERPSYGRNDAPLRLNLMTFYFQVGKHPEMPDSVPYLYLSIRGPAGFYFEEDCMENMQVLNSSLETSQFPCSTSNPQAWCPGVITSWPQNLEPEECLGIGHSARVSVPNPLARVWPDGVMPNFLDNNMYAFKIQVRNPELQIEDGSQWALDFVDFGGRPFKSLLVRTFGSEETQLLLASPLIIQPFLQTTDQQYMTFRLDFMPYTTVPSPRMVTGDTAQRRLQQALAPLAPDAEEGSLVLMSPAGFGFRVGDFEGCLESTLERKDRLLWDDEFFPSTEATCTVTGTNFNVLTYTLINQKALLRRVTYSIVSTVKNPDVASWPSADDWLLESFKKFIATEQTIRLDSYLVPGIPMITPSKDFGVTNIPGEYTAGVLVPEMNVSFRFRAPLRNGDQIRLVAPPGFSLGSNGECQNFQWSGTYRPLVYSPPPLCNCSNTSKAQLCTLLLMVSESNVWRAEVVAAEIPMSFKMSVINPLLLPAVVENFWRMEFWANQVLYSGSVVPSWPVYGLFQNLSIALVGTEQRAGALSDLLFDFTPSVFGTTLDIRIHEPLGFDFQVARVNAPWVRSDLTSGNRLLLIGGRLIPGEATHVTLSLVRLGEGGGPTRISLSAYADASMSLETARRINFLQGFRLPGAAMANNLQLWSERVVEHWMGVQLDSVSPLLPCHTNTLARFEIFVKVSRFILEGDAIIFTNSVPFGQAPWEPSTEAGYEPEMVMCLGSHGGVAENGTWLCSGDLQPVNVTSQSVIRNSVGIGIGVQLVLGAMRPEFVLSQESLLQVSGALQLEGDLGSRDLAMEADRDYRLRLWLRASPAPTLWTIRTEDARGFLSNTNDGLLPGVLAVPEMSITVTPLLTRSPPESAVWVRIHILTGQEQSQFSRLQLLMPYGFSPVGADAEAGKRLIVELSMEQGQGILDSVTGMTFDLRIQTPAANVMDARWFVLAKQVITDDITGQIEEPVNGWAMVDGFGVSPCPVTLMYGSIAEATGWLALSFYVPRSVQGRFVLITAPQDFEVKCPQAEETGLVLECQDFRASAETPMMLQSLQRTVNVTLHGGTEEGDNMLYMFLLNVLTPAQEPHYDPWQLRVLDSGFDVVDAALNIPQPGFVADLEMGNPSLSWLEPPQMGEVSNVQIEVSFLRRVKDVKAILVSLPEKYRHDIQHKNQLRNVNKLFPLTIDEEWRIFDNLRYIKVLVEVTESNQAQIITSGTYQWQFPVMVPLIEPFASEWYVSLCSDPACNMVGQGGILASFPVLNNEPQLPAKTFQVVAQTGDAKQKQPPKLVIFLALALASCW